MNFKKEANFGSDNQVSLREGTFESLFLSKMRLLACDYLVVGAGASGMAFVDELVHNSDMTVVILDKRAQPGGHWIDAYDFVRLHQPAALYGVNSRSLGAGGACLASKSQILAYYEHVMKELIMSGRVTWLPLTNYKGDGRIISLVQKDLEYKVSVRKKVVDATWYLTKVPSTHLPEYTIDDKVPHVPINGLGHLQGPWERYMLSLEQERQGLMPFSFFSSSK